jgi:hypothetical protein
MYLIYRIALARKVSSKLWEIIKENVSFAKINVRVVLMIALNVQFVLILQIEIKILLHATVKMDFLKT